MSILSGMIPSQRGAEPKLRLLKAAVALILETDQEHQTYQLNGDPTCVPCGASWPCPPVVELVRSQLQLAGGTR